ncbi:cutinase family protein [Leucobacter allii]|uniref:Cutinase family protein n=1 Tax=Leucobacter allii TaxID=2932247 RepID=A0ABY4FQD1_9MICO|nr:cutinase family protein [Leucobacter allii]UOQ58486.1 cutinase family protein [Leucobacter allii]
MRADAAERRAVRPTARTIRLLAVAALAATCAAGLVGCAPGTDPGATRESLTEVTQQPEEPAETDRYDAEAHPEPVVEALDCSPVLVVTARGTGEPSSGQLLSPVARAIAEARPDAVETVDVDYPADTEVQLGGTRGVRTLVDTLDVQAEACPEQEFVLLGYSQGALVIGDALADPAVRLVGAAAGEVDDAAGARIRAIVLYGDPRFVGTEPYNTGDYDPGLNGLLPRPPGSLDAYAERLRDYCVAGDLVCQSSLELDEEPHLAYYENGMQQDGAAFAITRLSPVGSDAGRVGDADAGARAADADGGGGAAADGDAATPAR